MSERDIFVAARERADSSVRAAFLDEACAGDDALRVRVERLLLVDSAPDSIFDAPAAPTPVVGDGPTRTMVPVAEGEGPTRTFDQDRNPADSDFAETRAPDDGFSDVDLSALLSPPQEEGSIGRLDHYEVFAEVGRGGMGVVLRAHDTKLRRVVALKLLAPALAAVGTARKRFAREAQSAAAVRNEHVVDIHEVCADVAVPYLVMEFISGITLEERIRAEGPLTVREVVRIGLQSARGLAAAHAQGLVHRDVKPGNILLEDGVQRVKLTDFGLARAADDASISRSGVIAGTPMYMSPEQAKGEKIEHRSDLFSLGSVLYTLCTGRPAFRAESTVAVLRRVCKENPRPIREVNPDVPKWVCAVVEKLMAKDPAERIQSADEVANLLARYLAHLEDPDRVAPPPAVRGVRASGRQSRRPVFAAVGLTAVVALAVTGYFLLRPGTEPSAQAPAETTQAEKPADGWKPPTAEELAARPGPLDGRTREQIPPALLAFAGNGNPAAAPAELVAILGDGQFRHNETVSAVLGAPTGKTIITACDRDAVRVWDRTAGTLLRTYRSSGIKSAQPLASGQPTYGLALSRDGRLLAITGGRDGKGEVTVWDLTTHELVQTLHGHTHLVWNASFSPDGRQLATAGNDSVLKVWDTSTGEELRSWPLKDHVNDVAFSPDGKRLAAATWHATLHIWDANSGEKLLTEPHGGQNCYKIAYSPDGLRLAAALERGTIAVWDAVNGKEQLAFVGHADNRHVTAVAFSPDGKLLASAGVEQIKVWDTATWKAGENTPLSTVRAPNIWVRHVDFSPDSQWLMSPGVSGSVEVRDARTGKERQAGPGHRGAVWTVAVSPDGRTIASGGEDGTVRLWDLAEWAAGTPQPPVHSLTGHTATVHALAFSPDGKLVASASEDGTIKLWDAAKGKAVRNLPRDTKKPISEVAFSADGRILAIGEADGSVHLWDVATGDKQSPLRWHTQQVNSVAFSPDNRLLASAGLMDRKVHITDLRTFRRVQTLGPEGDAQAEMKVAFGGDGRTLAYGGWDDAVRLWDLAEKKETVLTGSVTNLHGLGVDPTGRLTAASGGGAVRIWDRANPTRPLIVGPGPFGSAARHVAFTPEGRHLVVAGANGTVSILRTPVPRPSTNSPILTSEEAVSRLRDAVEAGPASLNSLASADFSTVSLTKADAAAARELLWKAHIALFRKERAEEMNNQLIKDGNLAMPFIEKRFGQKPKDGWSLYISLHGGGAATKLVIDRQWENQKTMYALSEGVYLAPRAPTNTWNLWHDEHIDRMLARLIEDLVVFEDVNPNRVYLLGYAAGGDGVYQIAPRMADRWAAAAMMGGHPNDASPLSLRNVPFALQVGENDTSYNRNAAGKVFGERLDQLRKDDPKGYEHFVRIHAGKGSWMEGEDRIALPWMAKFRRNPVPEKVVWKQTGQPHDRSYWLAVPAEEATLGSLVAAKREGQTIEITTIEGVGKLQIRFDDRMADLDKPVIVTHAGKQLFAGQLPRTIGVMIRTLAGRGDRELMFDAELEVSLSRSDPKQAVAHFNQGTSLASQQRFDEAIVQFKKAVELDPKYTTAHLTLGLALANKGDLDGSIASYRRALELDPEHSGAHNNLGVVFSRKGNEDEAIACYRKAIEVNEKNVVAHNNLGSALARKGQWEEAIACYRKVLELNPVHPTARTALAHAQRTALALEKLPLFLNGQFKPTTNEERLGLADLCASKKLYHASTNLLAEAFVADPMLADNLATAVRYNAACRAVLAAGGQADDSAKLDDSEKARLRKLALEWLRADLALRTEQLESGSYAPRIAMQNAMKHWQNNGQLTSVRDTTEVEKLPKAEREPLAKLWADVADLLKKAEAAASLTEGEIKRIAALPAEEQVEEVRKELMRRNPNFSGTLQPTIKDGVVTELEFQANRVADLAPVRALTQLRNLRIQAASTSVASLTDLSPLKGLRLVQLNLDGNPVMDLTPIQGMPLEHLSLWQWRGADLSPLRGMKLKVLNIGGGRQKLDLAPLADMPLDFLCINYSHVIDLTPLKKMPLTTFLCANTPVSDLTPLIGTKIKMLAIYKTKVSDLSPLRGLPLTELECEDSEIAEVAPLRDLPLKKIRFSNAKVRDVEVLQGIRTLETINDKPAVEFWKK